jgi:hypothetical protein
LFWEETRGRIYSKYEALQLVIDTLHPSYHMDLKFRAEKEFDQTHDLEDSIPFKLQMSQLGITLTLWSSEMHLSEKKPPRVLHIHHQESNDDDSLGDPGIFALSKDLKCSLFGRSGHENTICHKFMNPVIGEALMKSHPKEEARIMRENKQFVTVGPRGTPQQNGECTERRPPSAFRMVAHGLSPEDTVDVVDIKTPSDAHDESIDEVIQITRVGVDDSGSVSSEESVGNLDYGPTARNAMCQDVSMGVRYDEQLIDRINVNWDEELTITQLLGTWSTDVASTEPLYEEHASTKDTVEFYRMGEPVGKRYADDRTIVAVVGSLHTRSVTRILGLSTAYHHATGTSSLAPGTADQSDCSASLHRALIDTGAEASTTHIKSLLHKFQNIAFKKYMADAGDTRHRSLGFGYLKVVTNDDQGAPNRLSLVHCWYTPTLRHTVFSPGDTVKRHRKPFSGSTSYKNLSKATGHTTLHSIIAGHDIVFPGILIRT